jgi:hypothetical protein
LYAERQRSDILRSAVTSLDLICDYLAVVDKEIASEVRLAKILREIQRLATYVANHRGMAFVILQATRFWYAEYLFLLPWSRPPREARHSHSGPDAGQKDSRGCAGCIARLSIHVKCIELSDQARARSSFQKRTLGASITTMDGTV